MQFPDVETLSLSRFRPVIASADWSRVSVSFDRGRSVLAGRTVWHVSSTAAGGGVAELLRAAVGYLRGAGFTASWAVVEGSDDFFTVTKRIHHMLHGKKGDGAGLTSGDRDCYMETLRPEAEVLSSRLGPQDVVVLHDPQTIGLAPLLVERGCTLVWNCHIGVETDNGFVREARAFLLPYLEACDVAVFSIPAHVWGELATTPVEVVPPFIDAFSPKNQEMTDAQVSAILEASGIEDGVAAADGRIRRPEARFRCPDGSEGLVTRPCDVVEEAALPPEAPLVCQVSRWDPLKDHAGLVQAFLQGVPRSSGAHVVVAGPSPRGVSDDPEAAATLGELVAAWHDLPPADRRRAHVVVIPMIDLHENAAVVNALQRRADVVAQKSLAEGFGLTVAEALFKGRPVVASGVGGIRVQVDDRVNGLVVDDPEDLAGFGRAITALLSDADLARRLGERGRRDVVERFLAPRYLERYLDLLARTVGGGS